MAKKGGYGFGIVGCGMIADFHARAIEEMKGGHLACVFSRSKTNADRVANAFGCASYQDYKAFLAHPGLDIVAIATPSGAHLEPCEQAAKAGKHIICEKPLEVTLERVDRMIRACDKNRVMLAGIFPTPIQRGHHRFQTSRRYRPIGQNHIGGCLHQVVPHPGILRQRRLARNMAAGRRRRLDEPIHSHHRSAVLSGR